MKRKFYIIFVFVLLITSGWTDQMRTSLILSTRTFLTAVTGLMFFNVLFTNIYLIDCVQKKNYLGLFKLIFSFSFHALTRRLPLSRVYRLQCNYFSRQFVFSRLPHHHIYIFRVDCIRLQIIILSRILDWGLILISIIVCGEDWNLKRNKRQRATLEIKSRLEIELSTHPVTLPRMNSRVYIRSKWLSSRLLFLIIYEFSPLRDTFLSRSISYSEICR